MKKKYIKLIIGAAVITGIIVSCLLYTRTRSIEQRYPYLDFTRCTEMKGYYVAAQGEQETAFSLKQRMPVLTA